MPNVSGGRSSFGGAGHGDRMSAGRSAGGVGGGRTGGGTMSKAEQDRIVLGGGWGAPAPGREQIRRAKPGDWNGPRPGTNDRWGFNHPDNPQAPGEAQQQRDYNSAANDMAGRGFGGWLGDKLKGLVPGLHQVTPDARLPSTYAGGIYHDAWSPAKAAAEIFGMASPIPGTSLLAGQAAQAVSDAVQGREYMFGGGGWGPTTHAAQPGTFDDQNPSQPQSAGGFQNTGGGMAAFPSAPTPFGQQPQPQIPGVQPPGMPAFPSGGKIPNHTLPQGYESLFPNSLTAEDKALLYGKALMA